MTHLKKIKLRISDIPVFRDDKMQEYLLIPKLCWFDPYNLFVSGIIATPFHDFNWTYSVD